jgi:F0F1-type ATP synthase membrane subunit c/vacuolar-type H+-ATPase subunit K
MYKKLYTTAMTALLVGAAAFGAAYPGIAASSTTEAARESSTFLGMA